MTEVQRRFSLFSFFALFLVFVIVIRLIDIQFVRSNDLSFLSDENRFFAITTPQQRGVFLDRFGLPLQYNEVHSYKKTNTEALYGPEIPISHSEMLRLVATESATVSQRLSRYYRYPEALAHVVGYTNAVSRQDLQENKDLHIFDLIGRSGLEMTYENKLKGKTGTETYEIDALGRKKKLKEQTLAQAGNVMTTTLDPHLSEVALRALDEKTGAVVIMDVDSGGIISMVSSPSFNTNLLSSQFVEEELEADRRRVVADYIQDGKKRFFNRAIAGEYPPGSVFKLITAFAGLDSQKIDKSTTVIDEGVLEVGGYSYANWYYSQFGRVEGEISLVRSLARSNDIYFYKAAEWMGADVIADMARLFGYGEKSGIDLLGEAVGLVPDPAWKEEKRGEKWYLGNTYHFGIGQGDLLVTPLQVASMTQAVGNSAERCTPHLVSRQPECSALGIKENDQELVLLGMIEACSTGGTAFPFFEVNEFASKLQNSSIEKISQGAVACKTGTAEFGGANEKGIRKTHAWFIAIFDSMITPQTEDLTLSDENIEALGQKTNLSRDEWLLLTKKHGYPERLAIAVLVESDEVEQYREGSKDAAPVAKEIFDWVRGN